MPKPELGELRAYQRGTSPWDSTEYGEESGQPQPRKEIVEVNETDVLKKLRLKLAKLITPKK